jgi:hypothetical protein
VSIDVDTVEVRCRVPSEVGPRAAAAFEERVRSAVPEALTHMLVVGLAGLESDPRVLFIDALTFSLIAGIGEGADAIARRFVQELAKAVWSAIDDARTRSFRDGTEIWACYFEDLASGRALCEPWHDAFAGYRHVPASATLRSLIEQDPRRALLALGRLCARSLSRVSGLLDEADGRRSLQAILSIASRPCRDGPMIDSVLARIGDEPMEDVRGALTFVVTLQREFGQSADAHTLELAEQRREELSGVGGEAPGATVGAAALRQSAQRSRVTERFATGVREPSGSTQHPVPRHPRHSMRSGGFWLLLGRALRSDEEPLSLANAYGCAAAAFGASAPEIWADSALRSLLALPRDDATLVERLAGTLAAPARRPAYGPSASDRPLRTRRKDLSELRAAVQRMNVSGVAGHRLAAQAYALLRSYARRLPGFSAASNDFLRKNFLGVTAEAHDLGRRIHVRISAPPLQVIWRITGAGEANYALPDGRQLVVEMVP